MNKMMIVAGIAVGVVCSAFSTDWDRGIAVDGKVRFAPDKTATGYYPIVDVMPRDIAPGKIAVPDYWKNEDGRCVCVYKQVPEPPAPAREFYKYDVAVAATEFGKIDGLIGFLNSDVSVKFFWDAAEILRENDPYFSKGTNAIVQAGVCSEKEVRKILDRAYELGQTPDTSTK